MLFRTHLIFGLLLFLLLSFFPVNELLFLVIVLFGSLFPDIDSSKSFVGKRVKIIGWAFKHRGFFHSVFALVLFTLFFYFLLNFYYAIGFAIAFLGHLLLDALSKEGIQIFPFKKKIRGIIKVGSLFEYLLLIVLILLLLINFF
jgi:membrane-bound metal-dependent hydrolase YbcI (DUF457 family)